MITLSWASWTGNANYYFQAQVLLELIRKQDGVAEWIEKTVLKAMKPKAEYQRIQHVPGIGLIVGMVVVLEGGEFTRLASAGDYASYCRRHRG